MEPPRALTTFYRVCVLGSPLLSVFTIAMHGVTLSTLPAPLAAYERASSPPMPGFVFAVMLAAVFALLLVGLYATVGMWLYWRSGRSAGLWITAAGVFITPFLGPTVLTAPAAPFSELSSMAWTAALVLAYLSPVAVLFDRPQAAPAGGFEV